MSDYELLIKVIGSAVVGAPFLLICALGVTSLVGRPLAERIISRSVDLAILTGLTASLAILGVMLTQGTRYVPIELGSWVAIPDYHFSVKLQGFQKRGLLDGAILIRLQEEPGHGPGGRTLGRNGVGRFFFITPRRHAASHHIRGAGKSPLFDLTIQLRRLLASLVPAQSEVVQVSIQRTSGPGPMNSAAGNYAPAPPCGAFGKFL